MNNPFLLGPINSDNSVMLVSIQNKTPYILNLSKNLQYYWEDDINSLKNPVVFNISQNQSINNAFNFLDATNGGYLSFDPLDNVTVINSQTSTNILFTQPLYNPWDPPTLFLASVIYTLSNVTVQTLKIQNIPANNIIILPSLWYYGCSVDGNFNIINNAKASAINFFCSISFKSYCPSVLKPAWTTQKDCIDGMVYNYCTVEKNWNYCGTDNCNGPCLQSGTFCNFNSDNTFTCISTNKYAAGPFWKTPWFLGTVIGLAGIIFFLIILLIIIKEIIYKHSKNE